MLTICCFSSFFSKVSVHAETSGSVPVTYTKETSEVYAFVAEVKGAGGLSHKGESIRDELKRYALATDETMTFELKPDKGAIIKSIKLNGENAITKVENNKITVDGAEKEQALFVEFELVPKGSNSPNVSASPKGSDSPKTGDLTKTGLYLLLTAISLGVCIFIRKKKTSETLQIESGEEKDCEK